MINNMGDAFPAWAITVVILATSWISAPAATAAESEAKRSLDFEDSLVEGMNRKPLDSASHVGSGERSRGAHLYGLREDFHSEARQLIDGLKEAQ